MYGYHSDVADNFNGVLHSLKAARTEQDHSKKTVDNMNFVIDVIKLLHIRLWFKRFTIGVKFSSSLSKVLVMGISIVTTLTLYDRVCFLM